MVSSALAPASTRRRLERPAAGRWGGTCQSTHSATWRCAPRSSARIGRPLCPVGRSNWVSAPRPAPWGTQGGQLGRLTDAPSGPRDCHPLTHLRPRQPGAQPLHSTPHPFRRGPPNQKKKLGSPRQASVPADVVACAGGDPTLRQGCTPREAAAFAAERRARDNVWCPNEQLEWETAARGGAVDAALQAVLGAGGPEQQQADASARQQADASTRQPLSARAGPGSSGGPGRGSSAAAAAMVAALGAAPRRRWPGADGPAQQELAARASHPAATQLQQPQAPGRCPEVVDLTGASGSDEEDRAPGGGWQPDPKRARAGSSGGGGGGGGSAASSEGWPCPQCTLVNRSVALQCEACLSVRPARFTVP